MTQQEFLDKYGIKATFEDMSKATGYLKFAGDMLSSGTGKSAELMMYKQGLDFMFTKFIDSQTDMDGLDNKRALWELDLAQFAKDFESVMTSDPLKRDIGRNRKLFEGAELEALDSLKAIAQKYNEDIKDVLASRIKNGADLGVFRKNILINLGRTDDDQRRENRKNVSTMYLTMQKVVDSRTWKDRINPLNWWRMINENIFMLQINSRMKDITRDELSSDTIQVGKRGERSGSMGYRNFKEAMDTHADRLAYKDTVISDDTITELESYRNERAEQIPSEQELETTVVGRTNMTVAEASPDLDNTIEIQEPYENVPTKEHDLSIDSM